MTDILVFSLVAPMGSFGGLAGHEQRGSAGWPGRSAILGLLGAALGIRRDDHVGQENLKSWRTAVATLHSGDVWRDFHTVQTVPTARIKHPNSRPEALAKLTPSDNAVITRRDYRSDCAFGVAVWEGDLEGMSAALREPIFVPYLGRKCCPLSAPMAPTILTDTNPVDALRKIKLPEFIPFNPSAPLEIASDIKLGDGLEEVRHDNPIDRTTWHFQKRTVYIHVPEVGS